MKQIINKKELRDLILNGITTKELNNKYDYSNITDMEEIFQYCKNLKSIPKLDTSNVTNMERMFYNCKNLKSIPLLDTSKVIDMNAMFNGCDNLESIPHLDTSKVTSMFFMFYNCKNLKSIPLLDTSNVTDMSYMFNGCNNLDTRRFYLNAVKQNNELLEKIPQELKEKYGEYPQKFIKNLEKEITIEEKNTNPNPQMDKIKKDIEISGINLF